VKHLDVIGQMRVERCFFNVTNVDAGGAVIMGIKEKNALDVVRGF
jgi:hypothetical protein